MGISNELLAFLKDLKANNNKEWFTANKGRYETAKAEFETFITELFARIAVFDPSIGHLKAKECIFRIYRDVRFSKDKSPYKTHFGAHISIAAKKSEIHTRSGYYIHIEPGDSMLAGGAYLPQGDWLKGIRQEIDYNGADLVKILENPDFKKTFGEIEGEKLARMPKGYPEDHQYIELLKMKSFLATHKLKDSDLTKDNFTETAAKVFETLKPLGDFLNRS
ncbi:MAG TPA: DUF2461 domain-containing protein [Leadbetterella sp.]|nr:DUF2461 domain-containing protein [Leadbetterella sp.]